MNDYFCDIGPFLASKSTKEYANFHDFMKNKIIQTVSYTHQVNER